MKTPEVTSAKVATIAGRVLRRIHDGEKNVDLGRASRLMNNGIVYVSVHDLKVLAASCLTQTKDKKRK